MKLQNSKKGFSLLEMLTVVAIIGVLASFVITSLQGVQTESRKGTASNQLTNINKAMQQLYFDTGMYPSGRSDICETVVPDDNEIALSDNASGIAANGGAFANWGGPYMSSVPLDPWGNPYFMDDDYSCLADTVGCEGLSDLGNEESSVIASCGPNGALDGSNGCVYDADNVVIVLCRRGA